MRGLDWREVRLEDLGEFIAWLRLPSAGRAGGVAPLPSAEHHCSADTVNRKLSAVSGLYTFHARHAVDLGDLVTELQPGRRRPGWKPFLYHLSAGEPERRRAIKLRSSRKQPVILTAVQAQAILDACTHPRDRLLWALLWALLWDTGARIGEALGPLIPRTWVAKRRAIEILCLSSVHICDQETGMNSASAQGITLQQWEDLPFENFLVNRLAVLHTEGV